MVRDILIDIDGRDLLFRDVRDENEASFDVLWGSVFDWDTQTDTEICNILIPRAYWESVKVVGGEVKVCFTSVYKAVEKPFRVRLLSKDRDGSLEVYGGGYRGMAGQPAYCYFCGSEVAEELEVCQLPCIDIDGEFLVKIVLSDIDEGLDRAYIYSSKTTDIEIGYSDDQAGRLLAICAPGKSYRYPTTGVGITSYLNSVVEHSDLAESMERQFAADGKIIQNASFDSTSGSFSMRFNGEKAREDEGLTDKSLLDIGLLTRYDDEYVKRNIVITEEDDLDYISRLDGYTDFVDIVFFKDESCVTELLCDHVTEGKRFNASGMPIKDPAYNIVSATVEAGTIIMFDDEDENAMDNMPVFIINGREEERLYTHLVGQPMYISERCYKCAVIEKRSTLQYVIRKDRFTAGKGVYAVPQISQNIKRLLSVAVDAATGRIVGIVSKNTSISDVSLSEVTYSIYASREND